MARQIDMISRCIATTGLVLCTFFLQTAKAGPTTCAERLHYLEWTQEYFDTADAVFLGEVVAEETPDPPTPTASNSGNAATMADLLEQIQNVQSRQSSSDRLQNATFKVDKSWKGPVGPTITATASLYSDDTGHYSVFRTGESYLIFAYKSDDVGILHIPIGCAALESAQETVSRIRVLDALTKKPGTR